MSCMPPGPLSGYNAGGVRPPMLSMPGTRNSGCIGGLFGFTQTQKLELSDQLDVGIRFLDI
jgi:hypothetical protein